MEMPEGWKRLNGDKGSGLNDGPLAFDIDQALGTLKEMAEALELQSQWTTLTDEGYAILKKFKEWK